MGKPPGLAEEQERTLERLKAVAALAGYYLGGGGAVAYHLGHRVSQDVDLFSEHGGMDLGELRTAIVTAVPEAKIIATSDVTLKLRVGGAALDVVNYRYPPLEPPAAGPAGFRVAGLLDLATMKLAAISGRGLRRDFWDLAVILHAGLSLRDAAAAYVRRFGVAEADLYHVMRALTYFDDADREPVFPRGLTSERWQAIKAFFRAEAPKLLAP